MFLVISVYFNLSNILPKSGTFPPGHPVYRLHGFSSYPENEEILLIYTVASSCGASTKRGAVPRASALFIYISRSPQLRSCPTKREDNEQSQSAEPYWDGRPSYNGVQPGSARGSFGDTSVTTPSAMQPSARHLHPRLSRTEPSLATLRRSDPLQSIPSTPVTISHVTQAKDCQHVSE